MKNWPTRAGLVRIRLGKQLRVGSPTSKEPWLSVVGAIVANVRSAKGRLAAFARKSTFPIGKVPWVLRPEHLLLRTSATVKPEGLLSAVVREVHKVGSRRAGDGHRDSGADRAGTHETGAYGDGAHGVVRLLGAGSLRLRHLQRAPRTPPGSGPARSVCAWRWEPNGATCYGL